MKRKNSLKKLASFLGIASVSSLISVPVLAQMNVTNGSVNPSVSQRLDIAQNTPGTTGETGDTMNTPERMRQGGETEAPGTMRRQDGGINTPGTMNEPAGEMTTPEGMRQREGTGTPSNSGGPATDTNIPENINAPAGETNAPGRLQRQGEGSNAPGTMNAPAGNTNTPERMRRQGEGTNTPGTMNAPAGGMNNPARGNEQSSLSPADMDFVMKAAQHSMAEIQLGQLAREKAASDAVKEFGQMMIDHHTQANQELMQLASQKGLTLPTDMGAENQARIERLSKLSGRELDSAYMQEMVNAHAKDVSLFQSQTQQGQAQDVKAWAANKLPLLEEHLLMARSMTPEG